MLFYIIILIEEAHTMNTLYFMDCSPLFDAQKLQSFLPYLDSNRKQRLTHLATAEKRAQCAAAGWMLTHLFGVEGQPPALFHGSRGKPYLAGSENVFFSLSHTGNWVVCAVADQEVGVDAQVLTPYRDKVAKRCFTPAELDWVDGDDTRFTRLWSLKEAYLKYTGFGLVLPMSSFETPLPPSGWDEQNKCFWHETSFFDDNSIVAVALCSGDNTAVTAMKELIIP